MRTYAIQLAALLGLWAPATVAVAQAAATPKKQTLSVIDPDPIASPRAAAMGGAITPLADDLDAAFHNPAGIGGLSQASKGKDASLIRKLYFPWISVSANQNSQALAKDMRSQGAGSDSTVGKAVIDANAGKREYGRANMVGGMVLGRTMIVPFEDVQVASTARGQGTNLLDTTYRNMSGVGAGFSAQDSQGRLSVGAFAYAANRTLLDGPLAYDDIIDPKKRSAAMAADTTTTSAVGENFGMNWRLGKSASPTLGISVKNAGNTKFVSHGATVDTVKQDVSVGFAVEPQFGKSGTGNIVVQADRLTDADVALIKKYKLGTELLLGGVGSYATCALRAGYNYGGPSAGLYLNLGLIGFEAGVYSVDIAADNAKVAERREVATFFVNVADF